MDTPKFPHHRDCEALTGITLDHLPRDGSLGRVRRFAKGAYVWQPDDGADRIYFLRRGRVVVMTASPTSGRLPCARSSRASPSAKCAFAPFERVFGELPPVLWLRVKPSKSSWPTSWATCARTARRLKR